jgi:drug/metabolite transporter (DMT)-like permease
LVTLALSAIVLAHVKITLKLLLGTALAVGGVMLILAG